MNTRRITSETPQAADVPATWDECVRFEPRLRRVERAFRRARDSGRGYWQLVAETGLPHLVGVGSLDGDHASRLEMRHAVASHAVYSRLAVVWRGEAGVVWPRCRFKVCTEAHHDTCGMAEVCNREEEAAANQPQ